jgi:hypothetical protein
MKLLKKDRVMTKMPGPWIHLVIHRPWDILSSAPTSNTSDSSSIRQERRVLRHFLVFIWQKFEPKNVSSLRNIILPLAIDLDCTNTN